MIVITSSLLIASLQSPPINPLQNQELKLDSIQIQSSMDDPSLVDLSVWNPEMELNLDLQKSLLSKITMTQDREKLEIYNGEFQ